MHESHLIQPVIKGVSEHAAKEGAAKVSKIKIKIGDLTCVTEQSFRETFKVLAKDSLVENAELELTFFPGSRIEVVSFDIE